MAIDSNEPLTGSVEISYQKSNYFRVVHADGAYGGITGGGNMTFAFYSERGALPRASKLEFKDGKPVKETVTDARTGFVRELEVDITMSLQSAMSFYAWLYGHLNILRRELGLPEAEWQAFLRQTHV